MFERPLNFLEVNFFETSVTDNNNSPIEDYVHSGDQTYFWNDTWIQTFHSFSFILSLTKFNKPFSFRRLKHE